MVFAYRQGNEFLGKGVDKVKNRRYIDNRFYAI